MRTRFFSKLTPEEKEKMRQERESDRQKLAAEYQLGYYVGQHIYERFLPTLSVDALQSNKVIKVSQEEEQEAKRLKDVWFSKYFGAYDRGANSPEWKALRAYHEILEDKYLPKELNCYLTPLNVLNELEFKKGLEISLLDTDLCHYNIESENIVIKHDEDGLNSWIILRRD